jgi:hypothetical protein
MRIGVTDKESQAVDIKDLATLPLADIRAAWANTLQSLY